MTSQLLTPPVSRTFGQARFSMAPGERHAGHAHDSWHLLVVEAGGFEEAQGEGSFHVGAGEVRLSPAGLGHTLRCGETGASCRNIHLRDKGLARRLERALGWRHTSLDPGERPPQGDRGVAGDLDVFAFVARLCRRISLGDDLPVAAWLEEARMAVETGEVRIGDLAGHFRVSREHFSRQYTNAFGCSPVEARQIAATARAAALIAETDAALSEIALEAGFCDQSHMCRSIKARTGRSPGAFRLHA